MTPTRNPLLARASPDAILALRSHSTSRLEACRSYRWSWWAYWAQLAEMYLPQKYRWFVTPNQWSRGSPLNQSIVDETGLLAARTLATGMLSNLTTPTKPWFRLGLHGRSTIPEGPVKKWLADCTQVLLDIYAGSNLYTVLGAMYHQLVVFGSSPLIQYEDPEDVVHFFNPVLGEFMYALNAKLEVDTLIREYTYTVKETIDEFGIENVSDSTRAMARTAANLDTEIVISHVIEPNGDVYSGGQLMPKVVPASFPYREVFWERTMAGGQRNSYLIRARGFHERPHAAFRWDVTSNDPYGRSPGMDALPATRQLQIEQRRKAEAIDKMVRPPMVGSVGMKNEPASILPGGVTYTPDPKADGFKPAFTVEPRIAEMMEDLREVQDRVRDIFNNKLFTGISDMDKVQTAAWVDGVREEKLVLLGPVVERAETELDSLISRTFAIAARKGLLPPAPPEIIGAAINVEYISLLAEAQRAATTASIERLFAFAGNLVGVVPDIMDNLDADVALEKYADKLNVDPDIIRATAAVVQIRRARSAQQQAATALTAGPDLASAAKTMSETPVGGGQSALQAVLGQRDAA